MGPAEHPRASAVRRSAPASIREGLWGDSLLPSARAGPHPRQTQVQTPQAGILSFQPGPGLPFQPSSHSPPSPPLKQQLLPRRAPGSAPSSAPCPSVWTSSRLGTAGPSHRAPSLPWLDVEVSGDAGALTRSIPHSCPGTSVLLPKRACAAPCRPEPRPGHRLHSFIGFVFTEG